MVVRDIIDGNGFQKHSQRLTLLSAIFQLLSRIFFGDFIQRLELTLKNVANLNGHCTQLSQKIQLYQVSISEQTQKRPSGNN